MTEQTTPTAPRQSPLPADAPVHRRDEDDYDAGHVDGWHTGYRAGHAAALTLAPARQHALEALTRAWLAATGDEAARPALEALAAHARPLFEALADLRELDEAQARTADPDHLG